MMTPAVLGAGIALVVGLGWLASVTSAIRPVVRPRSPARGRPDLLSWQVVVPWPGGPDEQLTRALEELRAEFPAATQWVLDHTGTADVPCHRLTVAGWADERDGLAWALDTAYQAIDRSVPPEIDRSRIVVAVMAAEGTPTCSANLAAAVASRRLLGDPAVGAVQIGNRIRADAPTATTWRRLVLRLQDIEARGPLLALQLARRAHSTAILDGTGQLIRLRALDDVAGPERRPWSGPSAAVMLPTGSRRRPGRPAEAADLAVRLWVAGWRTCQSPPGCWVCRPAPDTVWGYLAQRVRWTIDAMRSAAAWARYRREARVLRRRPMVPALRRWPVVRALLRPWSGLIASLVTVLGLVVGGLWAAYVGAEAVGAFLHQGGWVVVPVFVALAFGEFWAWGVAYGRWLEPAIGGWRGLLYGFAYSVLAIPLLAVPWAAAAQYLARRSRPRSSGRRRAGGRPGGGPVRHGGARRALHR